MSAVTSPVRAQIKFVPHWDGPIEGWTIKFLRKQAWRTMPTYDFDDLYQNAYLIFLRLVDHYPNVVDEPHFQSLYQTSLYNHVNSLANKRTRKREVLSSGMEKDDRDELLALMGDDGDLAEAEFKEDLEDAPFRVYKVLQAVERAGFKCPKCRRKAGKRETTSAMLARISGLKDPEGLARQVKNFLTGEALCS